MEHLLSMTRLWVQPSTLGTNQPQDPETPSPLSSPLYFHQEPTVLLPSLTLLSISYKWNYAVFVFFCDYFVSFQKISSGSIMLEVKGAQSVLLLVQTRRAEFGLPATTGTRTCTRTCTHTHTLKHTL